jgi:hypothetical protein
MAIIGNYNKNDNYKIHKIEIFQILIHFLLVINSLILFFNIELNYLQVFLCKIFNNYLFNIEVKMLFDIA